MSGQYQPLDTPVPDKNDTWPAAAAHACVVCARRAKPFLAGSAIKAIGDFAITHVAYAWTLTVKAGEEL